MVFESSRWCLNSHVSNKYIWYYSLHWVPKTCYGVHFWTPYWHTKYWNCNFKNYWGLQMNFQETYWGLLSLFQVIILTGFSLVEFSFKDLESVLKKRISKMLPNCRPKSMWFSTWIFATSSTKHLLQCSLQNYWGSPEHFQQLHMISLSPLHVIKVTGFSFWVITMILKFPCVEQIHMILHFGLGT